LANGRRLRFGVLDPFAESGCFLFSYYQLALKPGALGRGSSCETPGRRNWFRGGHGSILACRVPGVHFVGDGARRLLWRTALSNGSNASMLAV
jgi:hypothetical protein